MLDSCRVRSSTYLITMPLPLLTVIPLSLPTLAATRAQLEHIKSLDAIPTHAVLFIADAGLDDSHYGELTALAKFIFPGGGGLIHTPVFRPAPPSYPHAHNLRFETAARRIAEVERVAWLFLPPSAMPMRKGWLLGLEREYYGHAGRFPVMGAQLTPQSHGTPFKLTAAAAIYPPVLPPKLLLRLCTRRGEDFEQSCAEFVTPLTHPTKLVWVQQESGEVVTTPPPDALLVVSKQPAKYAKSTTSLNGSAAPLARVDAQTTQASSASSQQTNESSISQVPKAGGVHGANTARSESAPIATTTYYHSGNLGDIIYGLAAIKLAGGGSLMLGPKQRKTPPCSSPITLENFERLSPLLVAQPYLGKASFAERHPGTDAGIDLNHYRTAWSDQELRTKCNVQNIAAAHAYVLRVFERWHPSQTWLSCDPITTPFFTIHRSARYHAKSFPWPLILKRYRGKLLFVGQAHELYDFQKEFNVKLDFWGVTDFLTMARVIAGSRGFIGNQSFPGALAFGLGQRVVQETWEESPDCAFPRANFLNSGVNDATLEKWEAS